MCFIKPCNSFIKPEIATEDIVCYKVIRVIKPDLWKSIIWEFTYEKNSTYNTFQLMPTYGTETEVYTTDESKVTYLQVNQGFHSYTDVKYAIEEYNEGKLIFNRTGDIKIIKCIIPEKAQYYANEKEYVSDTIITKEEVDVLLSR